jgi:hypothetical protein
MVWTSREDYDDSMAFVPLVHVQSDPVRTLNRSRLLLVLCGKIVAPGIS